MNAYAHFSSKKRKRKTDNPPIIKQILILASIVFLICIVWIGGHEYNLLPDPEFNVWVIGAGAFMIIAVCMIVILGYKTLR